MSRIEELIQQFCPEGVEFKELSVVAEIGTGRSNGNESTDNGKYPLFVRSKFVKKIDTFEFDEEAIIIPGEGGIGEIFHFINGKYALHQRAYRIHLINNEISTKFIYYYMMSNFKRFILQKAVNATVSSIRKPMVEKFQIPLPPLPIQQEIVNILDKFTQLEAELEAELEARKTQYEFYRNELLNFEGKEVEWKTMGEVCLKIENIKWKENQNIDFQYIDLSSVSRENNKISESQTINLTNAPSRAQQIVNEDDVIFGTTRPTLKRYSLITSKYHNQICSTGFCVLRANQEILLPKFLFFILTTTGFYNYVENNQEGAGYPSISNSSVKKFPIPIPPLAEQERIVSILDKFDALVASTSSATEGLPAEIAARRKQYEYYRSKLLSFEPLTTNH
ncbi:MAG: restriction endonuclease subunit S [Paludibacter sp.]|nr:restriction endonuclease subunit S [Paludibacter sp.]